MIRTFMRSPLPNSLAVVVLIALIVAWVTSLMLAMREKPVEEDRGWHAWLLLVGGVIGLPALVDLVQTTGIALVFALFVIAVFVIEIAVQVMRLGGRSSNALVREWPKWSILLLALGGLAVVSYLTFVEARGGSVSCGPAGGCDTVQHSRYSVLFGVLKVGYLGLLGYLGILLAWLAWQFGPQGLKKLSALALWGMCVFGVLFSIYLTSLEPFVIGATCMWCITSAVLMILLLLASTPAAQQALSAGDEDEMEAGLEQA